MTFKDPNSKRIVVRYSTVDRFRTKRTFSTLNGASEFARHWIGDHPEIGSSYAVSSDGIGKITVEGATLQELFPEKGGGDGRNVR